MRAQFLCLAALLCLTACEKEPKPEAIDVKAKKADDAQAKVEATDPALAEAVAAASVGAPSPGAVPGQVPGGPPADGVFAPGAADKELPKGAPPKITLGSEGDAPKHQLGPNKAGGKMSGTIQVAMQADPRQQAIPVLVSVSIEAKKAEAAKDDKPALQPVVVKITGAKIDAPGVPKDIDAQLSKLKGSKIEYALLPSGAGVGYKFDAAKGASEEFKDVVRSLSDAVALLTIPYPDKPLGKGGFFMVTSRDDFLGLDMVTYRMIRVKDMTDQGATLDVSTKRYAASRIFDFPGLPPEVDKNLAEFQANSEGTVQTGFGAVLPAQGQVTSQLMAQFAAKDPKQRLAIQIQTRAQLDLK